MRPDRDPVAARSDDDPPPAVVHGDGPADAVHLGVDGGGSPAGRSRSIDVILKALDGGRAGDILVIDDHGRTDQACIGDLVALEARSAGLGGIVVHGCHRDSTQIEAIALPVFSLGAQPHGARSADPRPPDPFAHCQLGDVTVYPGDIIVGDADGVVVIAAHDAADVLRAAEKVAKQEAAQRRLVGEGETLRSQFAFDD